MSFFTSPAQALSMGLALLPPPVPPSPPCPPAPDPVVPVELAVLAAGRHQPVRRTPLHHWHQEAGARWLDAGQWKRPESYVDPAAEAWFSQTVERLTAIDRAAEQLFQNGRTQEAAAIVTSGQALQNRLLTAVWASSSLRPGTLKQPGLRSKRLVCRIF